MSPSIILGLSASVIIFGVLFEMMRRHQLREKYAVLWFLVALGALLVTAFPGVLYWASDVVGVEIPANLLFFLASMLLLALSLQHSFELGRLEERTRTLAEEVALLRLRIDQDPTRGDSARGDSAPGDSAGRDYHGAGDQRVVADPSEGRPVDGELGEDELG